MSLHRKEKERDRERDIIFDDDRRVSFSLPRSKKLDKTEERIDDLDSLSDDVEPPSVQIKHKKKWKIKLPWKQKKQQPAYFDSHAYDMTGKTYENDLQDKTPDREDTDLKNEVIEKENVSSSSSSPSSSPSSPQKENRPSTWYGGYQFGEPSTSSALETRTNSVQIPKEEIKLDKDRDVGSAQITLAELHSDDVDFVSDSSTLKRNAKQNKGKNMKFKLNFKAFNQKTYRTYNNSDIKTPEGTERDLSSTEASSPDISKNPLSEEHFKNSNSSLLSDDGHNVDKIVESEDEISGIKIPEEHFIKSKFGNVKTSDQYKKSSSLPSLFKKYKKKKATDLKNPPLTKDQLEFRDEISTDSPKAHFKSKKSAAIEILNVPSTSDSELHSAMNYQQDRSGSQPTIHSAKRRTHRSIYKMSRSSFISSNASKSSDLLHKSVGSESVDGVESLPIGNDQGFRSLESIDIHSKSNSDFQVKSGFSRNYRSKISQKNTSSDISTSEMGSPKHHDRQAASKEKDFDHNFKSDFAKKMNQTSKNFKNIKKPPPIIIKSQKNKSSDFSSSDVGSPESIDRRNISKKEIGDQQFLKADDFTEFIKSYNSNKSKMALNFQKKKKSENLSDKNIEIPEFTEKEPTSSLSQEKSQASKVLYNSTKPSKNSRSSVKNKPQKSEPRNSSELSSSDAGILEYSDKEDITRANKTSEVSSVKPNEFTEFIKKYNSSKSSKILLKSNKHHQKGVKEHLNNISIPVDDSESFGETSKPSSTINNKIKDSHKIKSIDKENAKVVLSEIQRRNSLLKEKSDERVDHFTEFRMITNSGKSGKTEQSDQETSEKHSTDDINCDAVPIAANIVRRRSYEEMTNLIEEQMFASDSEGNSDTDGDDVDLSFGRKRIDSKSQEDDFKLCVVTEKGTFTGTELVYEPKILPKKEDALPVSKIEIKNKSPPLKRPSGAPPLPPEFTEKEIMSNFNSLDTKLPEDTFTKSENEKTKRKKLRKTLKTRSISNSSDSDTSIEDSNGTLYANFSSRLDFKRDDSQKREQRIRLELSEKSLNNNVSDNDTSSDSPPIFSPVLSLDNQDKIEIIPEKKSKYQAEIGHNESVNNKLASTSAIGVAKSLYSQREDKNNSVYKWRVKDVTDPPVENIKPPLSLKPPLPPTIPPPEDFSSPDSITIGGSYNLKNFSPKYEYAPNMPSLAPPVNNKRQPITCYSSSYRDRINATIKSIWKEDDKFVPLDDVKKHSYSFHRQEINPDFKYVQNQFSNSEHKLCNEKSNVEPSNISGLLPATSTLKGNSYERYVSDIKNTYLEGYNKIPSVSTSFQIENNAVKKHIVTFKLPSSTKKRPDYMASEDFGASYSDISHGEQNNQRPVAQNDKASYHSLPNNLQDYRLNDKPQSSPPIQRQVLTLKEDMLRAAQTEDRISYSNSEDSRPYEKKIYASEPKTNIPSYQAYDSNTYPQGIDYSQNRYIHMNSPIPYSKEGRQLKSILKSNYRRNEYRPLEATQPSLLHTNVGYIQPVFGKIKTDLYRPIPNHLVPSTTNSASYNTIIERVKIADDETSNSESEIAPPPALPSYPPPLPRQNWQHQQQFLGELLHIDSNPLPVAHPQQSHPHSAYYTPTIIEVEAHRGPPPERESVYQNVIHASQV